MLLTWQYIGALRVTRYEVERQAMRRMRVICLVVVLAVIAALPLIRTAASQTADRHVFAINGFMADGGDNYTMLADGQNVFNTGLSVTDIIQQYIQKH
jgi:hypothetical protein